MTNESACPRAGYLGLNFRPVAIRLPQSAPSLVTMTNRRYAVDSVPDDADNLLTALIRISRGGGHVVSVMWAPARNGPRAGITWEAGLFRQHRPVWAAPAAGRKSRFQERGRSLCEARATHRRERTRPVVTGRLFGRLPTRNGPDDEQPQRHAVLHIPRDKHQPRKRRHWRRLRKSSSPSKP